MLEYMTLCGNPMLFQQQPPSAPQPYPVPNGVPMGLVCLPDFVVDVPVNEIKNVTARKPRQLEPLDVGGRAGRLAWVLHNFGGQQNGWYTVKYVAKAGDVGRVVLKRRFTRPSGPTPFESTSLRYIVAAEEDRNWLHVYGDGLARPVESSHEGLEVTWDDVDKSPHYSLIDLLADARYVVISSKYAPHAISALALIAEGLERLTQKLGGAIDSSDRIPIGILLDLSALANQGHAHSVIESFSKLKKQRFAFAIESTVLCDRQPEFGKVRFDHVLVRESNGVRSENYFQRVPKIDGRPVVREAFTAGYVLASSCDLGWKLLRRWHGYCPGMRPIAGQPHQSVPAEEEMGPPHEGSLFSCGLLPSLSQDERDAIGPAERLLFAATLARHAESMPSMPLNYRNLLRAMSSKSRAGFNDVEKREIEFATISNSDFRAKIEALEASSTSLIDLCVPRFKDKNAATTVSLHVPPSQLQALISSCQLRDARQEMEAGKRSADKIEKAVMFDLDATLLDSGGMLRACWFNGLRAFFKELSIPVTTDDIHTYIDIYKTYVYDNHEVFRNILSDLPDIPPEWQPCDFRQIWNHRYAWAELLRILDVKPDPQKKSHWADRRWDDELKMHREHIAVKNQTKNCECTICLKLPDWLDKKLEPSQIPEKIPIADRREFALPLRDQLIRFKFAVQAGRKAFWEVDYPCFSQARSCIKMVRAVPGCQVYVVTEGHEDTQLQKLKCAGLSDLFPRNRVLSTGAASAAEQSANDLAKLLQSDKHTKEELDIAYSTVGEEAKNSLDPVLATLKANIDSISFLKDLLAVLYEKRHKRFYSAVIDAIRRKPESPAQLLLNFVGRGDLTLREESGGGSAMKFFMVGDRYDNDCRPLLELGLSSNNEVGIGTCRLLSGKRAKNDCPPKPKPDPKDPTRQSPPPPPTMLVCDTLAQVAHLLHDPQTWERIASLKDVTFPILLDAREGQVHYGRTELLALKFREMSWARGDKILRYERSVQDMLSQIEKDLAVCDVKSLAQFFNAAGEQLVAWRREASAGGVGPGLTLLKGALKILSNINWWRRGLKRPLIETSGDGSPTLEWVLGSRLLSIIRVDRLMTTYGPLNWAGLSSREDIDAKDLLGAIPYSNHGLAVVEALRDLPLNQDLKKAVTDWIVAAERLTKSSP